MKKRILALFLVCFMILSFASCGENAKTETDSETKAETTLSLTDEETNETVPTTLETETTLSLTDEKTDEIEEPNKETEKSPALGDFTAKDIDGNEVSPEIFKGKKVTMINIWATFCGPCINEMPDLEKLNKNYADKGFQIVGIVCDVENDNLLNTAKDIIEKTGVTYLNILPSDSLNEAKLSSVFSVPETIFVDENGVQIGESYIGSRAYKDWSAIIDSILEQA